jgi:hypothetical protein
VKVLDHFFTIDQMAFGQTVFGQMAFGSQNFGEMIEPVKVLDHCQISPLFWHRKFHKPEMQNDCNIVKMKLTKILK